MSEDRLVGHVAVDSGQLMVVDPSYVLAGEFGDYETPYGQMCRVIHTSGSGGGEWSPSGNRGTAVGTLTNGDGLFPVYAEEDSAGAIIALHIRLREWL